MTDPNSLTLERIKYTDYVLPTISREEREARRNQRRLIKESNLRLWKNAQTWDEIIDLNRMFLRGMLPGTPYHNGALNPDSAAVSQELLLMHDYGFFTHNGQGFSHERGFHAGKFYEILQKPYVEFVIPKQLIKRNFIERLRSDENLVVEIIDPAPNGFCVRSPWFGLNDWYNVTVDRSADTEQDLQNAPWEFSTRFPPAMQTEQGDWISHFYDEQKNKIKVVKVLMPISFSVSSRHRFGEDFDILSCIVLHAERAGMVPGFRE